VNVIKQKIIDLPYGNLTVGFNPLSNNTIFMAGLEIVIAI
jgi:hypothetical protein